MTISTRFFHFQNLGLKRNPFGSLTEAEEDALLLPIPDIDTWAHMPESLQLMGERGRGKSSLLRATLRQITAAGQHFAYESLPEGTSHLTTPLENLDGFALDEAQRLSLWQCQRLFWQMRGRRLIITTHEDLGAWFRLYRKPYRTVQVAQFSTPARVAEMITRRIAFFALDAGPQVSLTEEAFAWLWARYGDDVRSTEQALYEVFQRVEGPGMITDTMLKRILGV